MVKEGAYIFQASGCVGCHTAEKPKGEPLAGGRRLKTPFGVFVTPNISPDREHGVGAWSEADFFRAMREGRSPEGAYYFPAFPFASYAAMTDADLSALWAYLQAQPPRARRNQDHELDFPFNLRPLLVFWRFLYFDDTPFASDPAKSEEWNRGAYLVRVMGHCGECHTPRTLMGGMRLDREFAGSKSGPKGDRIPNITTHAVKGIGVWSKEEIVSFLAEGYLPDGDFVGGAMTEVVENSTGRMTERDLSAIAEFLLATPPHAGP
ncbi:MAG: cytochrome c [Alphaproteobacteria bacterium]|nr:cytochrome c [Alphaproteobacteria bacterium]